MPQNQQIISELVTKFNHNFEEYKNSILIDQLVYRLFDLTKEEIQIVEEAVG
jgi:hypothetical protein